VWRRSRVSVIDFVLGDLSVVQRLGATERWLLDAEGLGYGWGRPHVLGGLLTGRRGDVGEPGDEPR